MQVRRVTFKVKTPYLKMQKTILELGSHPVLLCDSVVYDIVGQRFEEYLVQNGLTVVPVFFNGEASDNEINRVVSLAKEKGCNLVIGLGGGKTIDSAKASQIF